MGLIPRCSFLALFFLSLFSIFLCLKVYGGDISLKFSRTPLPVSPLSSAAFGFEVSDGRNVDLCSGCSVTCKLDNYSSTACNSREISYTGLHDGEHTFEVCINGSPRVHCASYNWTVDTSPPTAYVSAATSFTSMTNVSVHVIFSESCIGGGGFRCSSNYCSLLVYGPGHVLPSTLKVVQPNLEFSVMVAISADIQYGRLVLVMDKHFCKDAAGNGFTRTLNSSFLLHFDRRNLSVDLKTHIPQKLIQINGEIRAVEATNKHKNLRIYLYFSEPVLNSSSEILDVLQTSSGSLLPTNGSSLGNRRFGYKVNNLSSMAIVTVACETTTIVSRQGTPVSPINPVTFLYDSQRPSVRLIAVSYMRTREHTIPVLIKFVKPVFDFNSSSILISGGHLLSFHEMSRSIYNLEIYTEDSIVSIEVPENTTADVAGNKNLASNRLQVRHYSVPTISSLVSGITTVVFAATSIAAMLITTSTASLLSSGVFSKPSTYLVSEPSRNLLRIACHIQIFALTKWLAIFLPIEYYEFARGIEWSIPYLTLPWETEGIGSFTKDSSPPTVTYSAMSERSKFMTFKPLSPKNGRLGNSSLYGTPLSPLEYRSLLEDQNMIPEAQLIMHSRNSNGWRYFGRNMFWLGAFGCGLMLLHAAVVFTLKLRKKSEQKEFGALVFPRFEIFLLILALPCVCQASTTIIRGKSTAGIAVGILLLGLSTFLLLSLLFFLSIGITSGKLLLYKEVHQEGQESQCYQNLIRVSLGPGKRGQWTWKGQSSSINLTRFGPLFEDLRGPPKYMLSQFSSGHAAGDQIIASDDETEDAEAPFIQKLFGILRIYYTVLETVKRVSLGLLAGLYSNSQPSKIPSLVMLSITAFQLFFIVLKKPFIKKRVQSVEIISVATELVVFVMSLTFLDQDFSELGKKRLGYLMLAVFSIGFIAQLINEWYSLYHQVARLSPDGDSFSLGLKTALTGLLLLVLPSVLVKDLGKDLGANGGDRKTSEPSEKPWMKQLRELAKESFSKDDSWTMAEKDPSSSKSGFTSGKDPSSSKSGFWGEKRSRSSSVTTSSDSKVKGDAKTRSKGLYKDLEAIFSSK